MPELPEAEIFKRYVDATSLHQTVDAVEVLSRRILKGVSARKLAAGLQGRTFESTRRHGKLLFVRLSNKKWLTLHFGMTDRLKYFKEMDQEPPYDRLLISFSTGYHLAFDSQRKLGEVELITDIEGFIRKKSPGIDAMDPLLDSQAFVKMLAKRRGMVKSILTNQGIVAGIGNAYADEILFQAGIHPETKLTRLNGGARVRLFVKMKDVLATAIQREAKPGQLPETYLIPHRQANSSCPNCGRMIRRAKIAGHNSYYCPQCQRPRR